MKKPQGIDEILNMLLNVNDEIEVMQEVGVISKERIAEIIQVEYEVEDIKDEIQRKMEDYSKKLQREYAQKMYDLDNRQKQFWDNVYKDIGSNGKGNHTLDRKTGVITKKVTPNDDWKG